MQTIDDVSACAALVEKADPDRFAATMAARPEARAALFAIYAFNVEVARAPWVTQESMIAEMRLQWWRDAVDDISAGSGVRRHQVVTPLAKCVDAQGAAVLDQLIEARRWDIYKDPFEDEAHFTRYLEATAGGLMWVAAKALGACSEAVARDMGYGLGVANWLRAIPALEAQKRVPLVDGREAAVVGLAEGGLARLARARAQRQDVSRESGQALLAGWQAEAILRQVVAEPARVKQGALGQSEFARRAGLAARALSGRW